MEENQGYDATLGNCSADPYICSLASTYASVSPWSGVSHPSLPNYLGVTSGATQGCSSDSCGSYSADNLGNQLSVAGIPWIGYMESMPSACYTGSSYDEYAGKHNPFVHYTDILTGGSCASHVLPYLNANSLVSTLDGANAPDFVWITPNLINDMHDGTVQDGNAWLLANLAPVLTSPWFTDFNSTVLVTMDESTGDNSGSGGGHIPTIVISSNAKGKGRVSITGNQYGTLRSIEGAYGLPLLGAAASAANGDLRGLFG